MTANTDIRTRAAERGVKLWQIAEKLGINDGNFSRKLRRELSESDKQQIFGIIDAVAAENTAAATNKTEG